MTARVEESKKLLSEILAEVHKEPEKLKEASNFSPFVQKILFFTFNYCYNPDWKMKLPDGAPPYTPDKNPIGLSPVSLTQKMYKGNLEVFKNENIVQMKREQIFIRMLESIHPSDAKVLLAIKDGELTKLYPKFTYEFLAECNILPKKKIEVTDDTFPELSHQIV